MSFCYIQNNLGGLMTLAETLIILYVKKTKYNNFTIH